MSGYGKQASRFSVRRLMMRDIMTRQFDNPMKLADRLEELMQKVSDQKKQTSSARTN